MRILITTTEPDLGDCGPRAVAYAAGLKKRGHEVLLAHCKSDDVMRAAQDEDIPLFEIATRSGAALRGIRLWDLNKAFRAFRPEVVHVDSPAAALASAAASPRTPVIMTIERLDSSHRRAMFAIRVSRARLHTTSQIGASSLFAQGITSRMAVILPGVDVADLKHDAREGPTTPIPGRRPLVVCANPHPIANGSSAWSRPGSMSSQLGLKRSC